MPEPSQRARATVLAALSAEAATTEVLYDRIGYMALMRAGLIDYRAFRATLARLEADGLAESTAGDDESGTSWRVPPPPGSAPEDAG